MSAARSSLGRGLGELADDVAQADTPLSLTSSRGFFQVPVDSIAMPAATGSPAPASADAALAASVRAHGLLQPILVRKRAEGYELIDGRRRLDAVRATGARSVPAFVLTDPVADPAALAAEANRHRQVRHAGVAAAGGGWAGSALSRASFLVLLLLVMAVGVLVGRRTVEPRLESPTGRAVMPDSAGTAEAATVPRLSTDTPSSSEPPPGGPAAPTVPPADQAGVMSAVAPAEPPVPAGTGVAPAPAPASAPEPAWVASLAGEGLTVRFTNGVAHVVFADPVFSSYATLGGEGADRLRELAARLATAAAASPLAVTVRGHTDPTPVRAGGRYVDNFDLGLDRAISALQFLRYHGGLTNAVLSAVSCAEADPPFANDSIESSLRNRTVTLRVGAAP